MTLATDKDEFNDEFGSVAHEVALIDVIFEEEAEEAAPVDIKFVEELAVPPFDVTDVVSKLSCVLNVNEETPSNPEKFLSDCLIMTGLSSCRLE